MGGSATETAARREMLRIGLRETLLRNGIPSSWISVEGLRQSAGEVTSLHARMKIHHRDVRLVHCLPAIETDFVRRVRLLDQGRGVAVYGVSWQFDLPDDNACGPLPPPGSWTSDRESAPPAQAPVPQPAGVIAGPLLLDEGAHARAGERRTFAATVPGLLRTGDGR